MIGLFGIFKRTSGTIEENKRIVERMLSSMNPTTDNIVNTFFDNNIAMGRVGLGVLNKDPQPVCDAERRYFLFMDGQVYGYTDEKQDSEDKVVLNLFLKYGMSLVHHIKGTYLIIVYDSKTETLYIMNSRYGQGYLYYYINPKVMIFASSLKAVLASGYVPKKIDEKAIFDFFKFEFITGDATFLEDVKLFPYATIAKITKSSASLSRYWDYPQSMSDCKSKKINIDDLVDEGSYLLKQAVSRQLKPGLKPAVTLSGGLDSRTISGYLTKLGIPLYAFHVNGHGDKAETESAKAICNTLQGEWHYSDLYDCNFEDTILEGINLSDGHISCNQFWLLDCIKRIKAHDGINYILDGFAMDILFQPLFIRRHEKSTYNMKEKVDIIDKTFSAQNNEFIHNFFPKIFCDRYQEYTTSSIEDSIKQFGGDNISCLTQYYHFVNRARRFVMGMPVINRSYIEYGFPGLDYDLFDFGLSLPLDYRLGGGLYRKIIMHEFPELRHIPWSLTGLPLDKYDISIIKKRRRNRHYFYYISRIMNGLVECLPKRNLDRRFRKDPKVRKFFMDILQDKRTTLRGYIDKKGIDRLIKHQDTGRNYISAMQSIITIELLYRNYIDENI